MCACVLASTYGLTAQLSGSYLACMLPGVQVTVGLGLFLHSASLAVCKDFCYSLLRRRGPLTGP